MAESDALTFDPTELYSESGETVLIAGQALAIWSDQFEIVPPDAFSTGVTFDLDYLGGRDAARLHANQLTAVGWDASLLLPGPDDMTPQTAKLVVRNAAEFTFDIDYLGTVFGYSPTDEARMLGRAVKIVFPGREAHMQVMHPFDVLKSRIHNYVGLPEKRNPHGLAQCQLALAVVAAFMDLAVSEENWRGVVFPMVENLVDLAASNDGVTIKFWHDIDPLICLGDTSRYPAQFIELRWPQVQRHIKRRLHGRSGGKRVGKFPH